MKLKFIAPKQILVGVLTLGSILAVSACTPEADTTVDEPAVDESVTEDETIAADDTAAEPMAGEMEETVVAVAGEAESFTTLYQAIEAAGLAETLSEGGPYTVFGPTDEAFNQLPEGTLDQLLLPENQETLTAILTYHVVPQSITSAEIATGDVETLQGNPLNVEVDEQVMVNGAMVVEPDIQASNGVIHAIDQVLLPPDVQEQLAN